MAETEPLKARISELFDIETTNNRKNFDGLSKFIWFFRFGALGLRTIALLLFAAGTLIPLIDFTSGFRFWNMEPLKIGYLCLAAAAVLMVIDRIALFTENHISKLSAMTSLDFLHDRLRLEKSAALASLKIDTEIGASERLVKVKTLIDKIAVERAAVVKAEIDSWAASRRTAQEQFASRISADRETARQELDKGRALNDAQREAAQPGGLVVSMTYPDGYSGSVKVKYEHENSLDGIVEREYAAPRNRFAFVNLPVGLATLTVALENGKVSENLIEIKAGTKTEVLCDLKT